MMFPTSNRRSNRQPAGQHRRKTCLEVENLEQRSLLSGYNQLNLVGYQPGMARYTDPNLNGWGMDFAPDGSLCVADTTPGVATSYDPSGQVLPRVVTIPAPPSKPLGPVGRPTGVAYNPTSDFVISENGKSAPAVFLFDSRDGTISGWNPAVDPNHAIIMVDNSTESPSRADYTGLVIGQNSEGQNVLFAADFHNNKIDMFDGGFHSLGSFTDPNVASQYPGNTTYGVEEVNGQLWVTFGAHKPGPYGGVVDIFDTDGNLLTPNHFAANAPGGPLANPWGIVQAPAHFGAFSHDILIGNVEGGQIDAFDPASGAFLGSLQKPDGTPIVIDGLWDLTFGSGEHGETKQLLFDAGPNVPNPAGNGLFGVIQTTPVTVLNTNDSRPGSLRDAIAIASSGDTIAFHRRLVGQTITLTSGELAISKNLNIEGPGADKLTISGNDSSRVFDVSGGATVAIDGLTISSGLADHGGGILNEAGSNLTLSEDTLSHNHAVGGLGGGAIFNDGGAGLSVIDCALTHNQATTGVNFDPTTGGSGGGAIFNNFGASLSVTDSDLSGNQAVTTVGFDNFGGGIYNLGGTATISDCTLENNQASGGGSSSVMAGSAGGAVENQVGATLTVTNSRFTNNQARCAVGNPELGIFYFAEGGALDNEVNSTVTINNSRLTRNQAVGGPGGGEGDGGAITNEFSGFGGNLSITGVTFTGNRAIGGDDGGLTAGGAIENYSTAIITDSAFTANQALGGDGGVGFIGTGVGGAIDNSYGSLTVEGCAFTGNQAKGGNGGSGGSGVSPYYDVDVGVAGGIQNYFGTVAIDHSTFTGNQAIGGSNAAGGTSGQGRVGVGLGGGLHTNAGQAMVTNSTFDDNQALGGNGNTGDSSVLDVGVGRGGGIMVGLLPGSILIGSNLTFTGNQAIGGAGNTGPFAGDGIGGGLANGLGGSTTLSNSTCSGNEAIGGQGSTGGKGGDGLGGGIANYLGATLTVTNCTLDHNRAIGGEADDGGNGGNGFGGGIYNDGNSPFGVSSLTVTGSTITHNEAKGGEGEDGGSDGQGIGGGLYLAAGGIVCIDTTTVVKKNHASTSNDDIFGSFTTC
jgi:uncharacterized protein (TIGR03118 family)